MSYLSSSSLSSVCSTSDHRPTSRTPSPRSPRSPKSPRYYHGLRIETALPLPVRLDFSASPGKRRGHGLSAPTTPSALGASASSIDGTTGPGFVAMFSGPQYKSSGHVVGYAPEGTRSRCRVCGTGFTPHKMRFGTFFAHTDGFIFLRWHHLRCLRPPSSLEDVTKLSGYGDLQPPDLQQVQDWVDGIDFAPASPPLSPETYRTSPSSKGGITSLRVGSPLSRHTTGNTNDELCSSTTSINSMMSDDHLENWLGHKGPGRPSPRSPLSPTSPSQSHRIIELASISSTSTSAARPRPGIGLTIDTAQTNPYFTPITSPLGTSPTACTYRCQPSCSGKGKRGGNGGDSGVFSSSPPRSGFLIDDKLPSPRNMSRGRKIKSRAKSPFFARTGRYNKGEGGGGVVELTAEEKKIKLESDRLCRAARTERHRRRSKTL